MRHLFLFVVLGFVWWSCGNSGSETGSQASNDQTANAAPAAAQPLDTMPSLPMETVQMLWENCDMIDYIWYDLPISMSVEQKGSIQRILRHIAAKPAPLKPDCKPAGRMFYLVDGENVVESDFYFSDGCTYFVFLEDGKPAYANFMTDEGIQYLNQNLQQVQGKY